MHRNQGSTFLRLLAPALPLGLAAAVAVVNCSDDDKALQSGSSDASATSCPSATATPGADSQAPGDAHVDDAAAATLDPITANGLKMINEGRQTFRFDTFGDQAFWGGALKLHTAIIGAAKGGVGAGLTPTGALGAGLKVDVDALPAATLDALKQGKVDLNSVDTTLALLQLNAVVGVTGVFDASNNMTSIGIQCALCHSTVDDAITAGVGHRLDGWPNRDLNVGAIVNMAPDLSAVSALLGVPDATVRAVLLGWGPGKYDAQLFLDRKATAPDGGAPGSSATLIPAAFGLAGVNLGTSTGWGSTTYWNAFVANLEMHGQGTFFDPRLDNATDFPIAADAGSGHTRHTPDLITSQLAALQVYQLAIPAPTPPAGSFDAAAATRGKAVFEGPAKCASCHVPPLYTEPGWNMHTGAEIGIDDFQANRSPDKRYRTAPLKGLFAHAKGGFYHDGRYADLAAVVNHYDTAKSLALTAPQKSDLVEFLKSL